MLRYRKIAPVIVFFGFAAVLMIMTAAGLQTGVWQEGNKIPAPFPAVSLDGVLSGSFMSEFDAYMSDRFALRSRFLTLKTKLALLMGKKEVDGVYIRKERMIAQVSDSDGESENVSANLKAVNDYIKKHPGKTVGIMLVPTAAEIYRDLLPKGAPNLDQKAFISRVYRSLDEKIVKLDALTPLNNEKDNDIFYKTDSHWTSYGAFIAYSYNAKSFGLNAVASTGFNLEHASYDFWGDLHSKTFYQSAGPDRIDLYYNTGVSVVRVTENDGIKETSYNGMFLRDKLEEKDKYAVFPGRADPVVTIRTSAGSGKRLLIFKDSFAHSFVQFLTSHYEEITLVDLRYLAPPYDSLIDTGRYDSVLLLYSVDHFARSKIRNIG